MNSETIQNDLSQQTETLKLTRSRQIEIIERLNTFEGFVREVRPSFQWYRHCAELGAALEAVKDGKIKRLMVFMPPRHGKSEEASRLFPAYYLYHHPTHHFGITSYAAELAQGLNRDARDNYLAAGNSLGSTEGIVEWRTDEDGRAWAAGVGGPITGKGGDCLLIDDPFKNEEEAYSEAMREKVWDWYQHTFLSRLHPNAAIILICTRWHEGDLAGKLLEDERTTNRPERWTILNFEAIKQEVSQKFPSTCNVIPDWRKPGEVLCPERYSLDDMLHRKAKSGDRAWRSLYQQNPVEEGGNIWKIDWFKKFSERTNGVKKDYEGIDWDLAYGDEKDEENAASAFIRSKLGSDGNIYVYDCDFQWYEFPKQVEWMKGMDAPHYIENKGPGKSAAQMLVKAGAFAQEVKIRGGDKVARTILATPLAQQGKIFIHEDIWDKLLFDERQGILGFPAKPFNDLNDAFTQMIHRLWPAVEKAQAKPQGQAQTIEEIETREYLQENIFDKLKKKAQQKTTAIHL